MQQAAAPVRRMRIWDLPTRLFHWLLVAAAATAVATAQVGGNWMELHGKAGLAIAGLLVFRLVWGFAGNRHARFASFFPTPGRLRSYVQGTWQGVGHNPLGALSVLAILLLLALQVGSGLFGTDEIAFSGPLAARISEDLSLWLTGWHHRMSNLLYVLLGLHVLAIAWYRLAKKDDLVRPMLTGYKEVPGQTAPAEEARAAGWPALLMALSAALLAVLLLSGTLLPAEQAAAPASPAQPAQTAPIKPAW